MTSPNDSQQQEKKRTCWIVDFAVPIDYKARLKENKKKDKYSDLVREQKNYRTWKWRWYQLYSGHSVQSRDDS